MLRYLLWRLLGAIAFVVALECGAWLLSGGPGHLLRSRGRLGVQVNRTLTGPGHSLSLPGVPQLRGLLDATSLRVLAAASAAGLLALIVLRWRARTSRRYIRLTLAPYRTDRTTAAALVEMFESLGQLLSQRWWRRLHAGQPSVSVEVHYGGADVPRAWFAVSCPAGAKAVVEGALRGAYPNCHAVAEERPVEFEPALLRLKKRSAFIRRAKQLDRYEQEREPPVNRLITAMAACAQPSCVQIALTPAPRSFERLARALYKHHEARLSRERREHARVRDRSLVDDAELRGGLDVQHRPLFFVDLRVVARRRRVCEQIAAELRAGEGENRLVERGTALRHGVLGLYDRRLGRGEGNPVPSFRRGVFASTELAALWQLPASDYAMVPVARSPLPFAPAPPAIFRAPEQGTLRDAHGTVSIHVEMRRQNTAVPGTVEQGKSSYLVATVAEDLRRSRCAVIVLDPKGDAAEAAVSLVSPERTCTLLDLSRPSVGFNPLAVDAPADVIADYVVAALKNLFTDADIRASSDRYLRNAVIAVLAHDRRSTLWDAARLLSVGEEGYAYRRSVGARVRALPEFKEIADFFTAELSAQLADARGTTTAKLDAPVNKLARLLNSASIKRVLLNDSLVIDFERIITGCEVLVVKGALGVMGAGNTAVVMQLLVGMLDAALARQQDLLEASQRVAVALKVDEAPLVLNRGFAETMALKRSAGLETVACWQADAQWTDRDVREQLDALFAHRVYFATASARDARAAVGLTMAEFSDSVRPGVQHLSALGHPDVRLHLPKHHAIASWTTPAGRQAPFIAQTLPMRVDRERLALHAARQRERGGMPLIDLRQAHWDERGRPAVQDGREGSELDRANTGSARVRASSTGGRELPAQAAASYRELVDLDRARSARHLASGSVVTAFDPDPLDVEILCLIARLGHVLTSQVHRRFNPDRAVTTTQRRLKRLADAGLLGRLQMHRRDGGGVPVCCSLTGSGAELLRARGRMPPERDARAGAEQGRGSSHGVRDGEEHDLASVRRQVHVAGWVLAFTALVESGTFRGRTESALSPPSANARQGGGPLAPGDLQLPGGRVAHDFLRTDATGRRSEAERFETVRPDATIELDGLDVAVELAARRPDPRVLASLERYDHLLAGWALHLERYGRRAQAALAVVRVCRDRPAARALAEAADQTLCACRAYAGEYPFEWQYPGREGILFVAERDIHEGLRFAYGVPRLPPQVRIAAAHGDPRAGEAAAESCALPEARTRAVQAAPAGAT